VGIPCTRTPVAILIHGLGQDLHVWDTLVPHLEGKLHTRRFDMPGHGCCTGSADPFWESLCRMDEELAELAPHSAVLVGHSLGGLICLLASQRHPDRVCGMVLSAVPFTPGQYRQPYRTAIGAHPRILQTGISAWLHMKRLINCRPTIADPRPSECTRYLQAAFALRPTGHCSIPTTLLYGRRDRFIQKPDPSVAATMFSGKLALGLLDSDHHIPVRHPDTIARYVLEAAQMDTGLAARPWRAGEQPLTP
jgi:pimeloyl-ACP methyl ester carboxylesterase